MMDSPFKARLISLCATVAAAALSGCSGGGALAPPVAAPVTQTGSSVATNAVPLAASDMSSQRTNSSSSHTLGSASQSSSYVQTVLADAPNVFYPLNDASSTVTDIAGGNVNGSYGSLVSHAGPPLVSGSAGSASLPGGAYNPSAFAQVAPASKLAPSTNLSLEMWVRIDRPNTTGSDVPVVAYGRGNGLPYKMSLTNADKLTWRIHGGAPYILWHVTGKTALSLGRSHHIVGTYNGATLLLYVDGALDGSFAAPGPLVYSYQDATNGLGIGTAMASNSPTFAGDIADVAIYQTILSPTQIATHYQAGYNNATPAPTPSPTATAIPNSITEKPSSVNAFTNSIGYNAHVDTKSSVLFTNWSGMRPLLLGSGASHLRSTAGNSQMVADRLADLCANGIQHSVNFLIDDTPAIITSTIDWYGANCVDAVEPANEYDAMARNPTNPDPNWVAHILAAQKTLYDTIKMTPRFSHITVLGPGLSSALNYVALGNLEGISDAGNQHWSNCDGSPNTIHYKNIVRGLAYVRVAYPTKPIWTTETANGDNLHYGCALPDSVIAKYQPRTFLTRFNLGQPKTYIYEFVDVADEGTFGYQGAVTEAAQPKPQYTAIKSLVSAVGGKDTPYNGSPLTYSMTGATSNVQHTLLQGSDGKYRLVVWLEVDSWDVVKKAIINPPAQAVTLNLSSSVHSVSIATSNADFTMSAKTASVNGGTIQLNVTDSPSVVTF